GRIALPGRGQQVLFADLDGDGREEPVVVFGDADGCTLARVLPGTEGPRIAPLAGGTLVRAPSFGDADGDGTVGLAAASEERSVLRRGLGRAAFAEPVEIPGTDGVVLPPEGCTAVPSALADVRGDARQELILPVAGGVRVLDIPRAAGVPLISSAI